MRRDILQKFPFLDTYFDRTVAPEDNVSFALLLPCYSVAFRGANGLSALLNYLAGV